jgi:hypothetical protein
MAHAAWLKVTFARAIVRDAYFCISWTSVTIEFKHCGDPERLHSDLGEKFAVARNLITGLAARHARSHPLNAAVPVARSDSEQKDNKFRGTSFPL